MTKLAMHTADIVAKNIAAIGELFPNCTTEGCNESVNFDTTQNLFIEGDNLDALKLLQAPYHVGTTNTGWKQARQWSKLR